MTRQLDTHTAAQSSELMKNSTENQDLKDLAQRGQPLNSLQKRYKSKTFMPEQGINPLSAAASSLFSLIGKFRQMDHYPKIEGLHHCLVHEINAFIWNAQRRSYSDDEVLIARYIICATLDETIQNTVWGKEAQWHKHNLLTYFQGEVWGGERFFFILEKLREFPETYIDLLEFIYLCLSSGFEGQFRVFENGKLQLESIVDDLYHLIRKHRRHYSRQLNHKQTPYKKFSQELQHLLPLWMIICVSVAILLILGLGSSYVLHATSQPLYSALQELQPLPKTSLFTQGFQLIQLSMNCFIERLL